MTRLPERLPAPLSERIVAGSPTGGGGGSVTPGTSQFVRQGREVDVAIGGIPFRLATSNDMPITVETIPTQRNQVDTEPDPGEQSLSTWWRRSQSSWHQGAGDLYQESSSGSVDSVSFYDSSGVDVFTPGRLTLLKKMVPWISNPGSRGRLRSYVSTGGVNSISMIDGGGLYRANVGGTFSAVYLGSSNLVDGLLAGDTFYAISSPGGLYKGGVTSGTVTGSWDLGSKATRMAWGKHRLWVIGGRNIWQPDLTLAQGTTQTPVFANPNEGWTYTCMAEGTSAMLFGGNDGFASSIQAVTLDSSGGVPTLSGATITAALPDGELVQEIAVLAGEFVGIGTSRGFRIGVLDSDRITYGPLIISGDDILACTSVTTQGQFFLVGFDTTSNESLVYRVDSGTQLDGGIFPYAKDADCGLFGPITSVAASGSRVVCVVGDGSLWQQSVTQYVSNGWLQTGRIRYRTTEPKLFKRIALETEPLAGSVAVSLVQEGGGTLSVGNITSQGEVASGNLPIAAAPMRYASVKLTLAPDDQGLAAPIIHSYAVSAIPAVAPQRMYTLPLLCYDREKSISGQWYGGASFAADRLLALQLLEDSADILTFQDFTGLDSSGRAVTIESLRFVQTAPATIRTGGSVSGAGGILIAQLRTVT